MRASFRDPGGILVTFRGRILRFVTQPGLGDVRALLASEVGRRFAENGRVVGTTLIPNAAETELLRNTELRAHYEAIQAAAVFEHERIAFPSFPYEWPPEMLHAAGQLTLQLARECLKEGLGIKDATPFNVLFQGPEPVFVDILSFERRDSRDPAWLPYAQFVRTFLLPLMANKAFGLPLSQAFASRRDGLTPQELYGWLGPLDKIRPPFLTNVSIPVWLASLHDQGDTTIYRKRATHSPEKARFILDSLLRRLQRTLRAVAPAKEPRSAWSGYMTGNNNYTPQQSEAKRLFVAEALRDLPPAWVLDVGCNTGAFSELAARSGAAVLAIDYDPVVVGQVWRRARTEKLNILPLAVDLTRPTPAVGWMNREKPSFLERASSGFDTVMMLAVIHHMLVSERIPLIEIMGLAARLSTKRAIVEFVAPEDSMFRQLAHGREDLHRGLTTESFEQVCRQQFDIVRSVRLPDSYRWMYLLQKRAA